MANEFIIKNGFHSKGDSQITGSLNVKDSLTVNGSAVGAAFPFTGAASISGSLSISGSNGIAGNLIVHNEASFQGGNITVNSSGITIPINSFYKINSYSTLLQKNYLQLYGSNGPKLNGTSNGLLTISDTTGTSHNIGARLGITGKTSGGTSSTLIAQNSNGTNILDVRDDKITFLSGSVEIKSSGSISSSAIFSVIGSEGDLFTITDSLTSGSLFAVKDISGFPLLDVTKKHDGTPDLVTVGQSDLKLDSGSISVTGSINLKEGSINVSSSLLVTGSAVNSLYSEASEFTSIWSVRSPSGGQYQIEGPGLSGEENQPALYLTRGQKYRFTVRDASSHPFYIQTSEGAYNASNVYTDGITGSGTNGGNLDWNIQFDAPTKLYYVCSAHSGMGNAIYIADAIEHSGSFSGSFEGDGTNLDLASNTTIPASNPFPISASSAQIISRSFASGHTDSTALRLLGSGSVSESGIFEVKGSVGPLFSVADGLDGILMEVNDISGLPLLQVSSSGIVRTPVGITSQRPVVTFGTNFTASSEYEGYYFRVGGEITCSIRTGSLPTVNAEFDFFQTSSAGNLLFETASTDIIVNSKNGNLNLAGQFSSATLKYIGNNTFDLMGDLT